MRQRSVILFIDDEKAVLDSLLAQARNFWANAFDYETAQSTEEAWEIIHEVQKENRLAAIISDWLMPMERGDTFLIKVAQMYPKIPLIMLSAYADKDAIERAQRYANLHAFFRKPWDKDELLKKINQVIEQG
ncbi:MAG: response regulator [Bacteroidia bacterium]